MLEMTKRSPFHSQLPAAGKVADGRSRSRGRRFYGCDPCLCQTLHFPLFHSEVTLTSRLERATLLTRVQYSRAPSSPFNISILSSTPCLRYHLPLQCSHFAANPASPLNSPGFAAAPRYPNSTVRAFHGRRTWSTSTAYGTNKTPQRPCLPQVRPKPLLGWTPPFPYRSINHFRVQDNPSRAHQYRQCTCRTPRLPLTPGRIRPLCLRASTASAGLGSPRRST